VVGLRRGCPAGPLPWPAQHTWIPPSPPRGQKRAFCLSSLISAGSTFFVATFFRVFTRAANLKGTASAQPFENQTVPQR